ncbi:MAG: hypothetical protein AB7I37_07440 [Pirellulales bacterium]
MRFRRRLKIWFLRPARLHRVAGRRFVATMALLAFVGTAVGLPLPLARPDKDRSQPFPCADRPCGCRNAEQCWRECCCFSMPEKLAWARRHGVTPPDFVVAAAQRQQAAQRTCTKAGCQHCSHKKQAAAGQKLGCCKKIASQQPTWCDRDSSNTPCSHGTAKTLQPTSGPAPAVIGALLWRCQGGSPLWNAVGGSLPPPSPVVWSWEGELVGQLRLADKIGISPGLDPPVPPPRMARWPV